MVFLFKQKHDNIFHIMKGCYSDILLLKWRITWNYVYSPFNVLYFSILRTSKLVRVYWDTDTRKLCVNSSLGNQQNHFLFLHFFSNEEYVNIWGPKLMNLSYNAKLHTGGLNLNHSTGSKIKIKEGFQSVIQNWIGGEQFKFNKFGPRIVNLARLISTFLNNNYPCGYDPLGITKRNNSNLN